METTLAPVTHNVKVTSTNELNKEALNALIAQSEAAVQAAVEGSSPGQYPVGSKAALQAAINTAKAAADKAVNQAEIDQAVTALNQALQAFKNAVHVPTSGDTNSDGKVTVGDLGIAAASYGKIQLALIGMRSKKQISTMMASSILLIWPLLQKRLYNKVIHSIIN